MPKLQFVRDHAARLFSKKVVTPIKAKKPVVAPDTKIGVITLSGEIKTSDTWVPLISKAMKDDTIKGVIAKVESPGGVPGAGEAIYIALKELRAKKPVVVLVENMCCSAGYLIACGGDMIISTRMADIGSIGVVAMLNHVKKPKTATNEELSVEFLTAGKHKIVGNAYAPSLTPEQRDHFMERINQAYNILCRIVSEERGLCLNSIDEWGDAQVFGGEEAVKRGLVDKNGSIAQAEQSIMELLDKRKIDHTKELALVNFA
ncbi:S49 family peptidase [bacterium]|nr:S49 family peptidase [bacterium]MBT5014926.1 S49 family peptidase [bacterium]